MLNFILLVHVFHARTFYTLSTILPVVSGRDTLRVCPPSREHSELPAYLLMVSLIIACWSPERC